LQQNSLPLQWVSLPKKDTPPRCSALSFRQENVDKDHELDRSKRKKVASVFKKSTAEKKFFEMDFKQNPGKTTFSLHRAHELQPIRESDSKPDRLRASRRWAQGESLKIQRRQNHRSLLQKSDAELRAHSKFFSFGYALALAAISVGSVSCTNSLSARSVASGGGTSTGTSTGTTQDNSTYLVNIKSVLFDNVSPTTTLDIFGDGSNAMAQYCFTSGGLEGGTSSSQSTSGPSNCACTFSYLVNGVQEIIQSDTTYHESNMIECSYAGIPSGTTSVTVSVELLTENQYSNSITFALTSTNSTSNTTNINNFALVSKYQCSDVVTIPFGVSSGANQLGSTNAVYDPILSDKSGLSYPLDFYTTNMGGTLAEFVAANLPGQCSTSSTVNNCVWSCPAPTPNMTLYSVGDDPNGGGYQIYPYSGSGEDRSTFYLSKTSAGIFTVDLNAYIAPTMLAETYNQNGAPLGYGAPPVPGTSAGTESCPSASLIPSGYQWVKVWLYRAALQGRTYPASSIIAGTNISCSPGFWQSGTSANVTAFTDCNGCSFTQAGEATTCNTNATLSSVPSSYVPPQQGIGTNSLEDWIASNGSSPAPLADRIISSSGTSTTPMCVDLNTAAISPREPSGSCTQSSPGTCQGPGATTKSYNPATGTGAQVGDPGSINDVFGYGTDIWLPRFGTLPGCTTNSTNNSGKFTDSLDLCGWKNSAYQWIPKDMTPSQVNLDGSNARYDFVFVVTPTTINSADMEAQDSTAYPYIPIRWPNASDCSSANPNNPDTTTDCPASKMIQYGLQLQAVATSGAPTGSSSQPVIFPMCAIQPCTNGVCPAH
jgi:hypothetical protein